MRGALFLAATLGCSFEPGRLTHSVEADARTADGAADGAIDSPTSEFCAPDPTLVACYRFEGTANDESGHGLHATTQSVSFVPGRVGMAMQFGATSAADVAESPLFDVAAVTLEAWVNLAQLPAPGTRMGIVDNNGQWGMFVYESGRLLCPMTGGLSIQGDAVIAANVWTHVACTYDGATTVLYVNGKEVSTASGGATLATSGTTGISIASDNPPGAGSRLDGLIDELRILSVARDAAGICADARCTP